jgi:DNA-binding CsgD family transcriptional regulator
MAVQRPPGFRGRASERAVLDRLLECVRGGQSAVLVMRGEAGVGKTALLRYTAGQASGLRVAHIAGVEAEMELAFAALHQLCAPMLDCLESIPEPQREALCVAFGITFGNAPDRFLVALGVLSLLSEVARAMPLVCLVDDAHWVDTASSQVMGFVARRLLAESVGIVFAVREPNGRSELVGLPELFLSGLEYEASSALLADIVAGPLDEHVRGRILAETRGNPLALLELSDSMSSAELAGGFALPSERDVPRRIEERYSARARRLPPATQKLLLLAAADPVGDAALLWRAAEVLEIDKEAAVPALNEQLMEIGARVRFRHPLVRSAVYQSAPTLDRRAVHKALASVTDRATDGDRRAWHRAQATEAPDEDVARDLLECANDAQRRGGIAASAAFLERAASLSPDPKERAIRALAAARAKFDAGDLAVAGLLVQTADELPLDEVGKAQVARLRGQIAFDTRRGKEAPAMLLSAARRLEQVNPDAAQDAYLETLLAVIYAGGNASETHVADVARAALSAQLPLERSNATHQLRVGLATRLVDGPSAATPSLIRSLRAYRHEEPRLDWLSVAYTLAAMELWDDQTWFELVSKQADLARQTGTIFLLPYALDYLAWFHIQSGDLLVAEGLVREAERLYHGTRAETLPYVPLRLAAWRGQDAAALSLAEVMVREARLRGEGCAFAATQHALAVLYNGLGQYEMALGAAQRATRSDEIVTASWALPELIEAASRCGQVKVAEEAVARLSQGTLSSGTEWARGTEACSRAFIEKSKAAEERYLEAIEALTETRMLTHLARARLNYGEWLRREGRRVDARGQLREAYELLKGMGAQAFAERARRELLGTGEKVRKQSDESRADLTPQEEQIARLAREGLTNPEIGAELFLSARTVEWHLRKVFAKLGINSRKGLDAALQGRKG